MGVDGKEQRVLHPGLLPHTPPISDIHEKGVQASEAPAVANEGVIAEKGRRDAREPCVVTQDSVVVNDGGFAEKEGKEKKEKKEKKDKKEKKERQDGKKKNEHKERTPPDAAPVAAAGYPGAARPSTIPSAAAAARLPAENEAEVEETGSAGSSGNGGAAPAVPAAAAPREAESRPQTPSAAAALLEVTSRKMRLSEDQLGSRTVRRLVAGEDSAIYRFHLQAQATLHNSILYEAVKKPSHVDREPWIAAKTVAIFDELEQFITIFEDICPCRAMTAGKHVVYKWKDEDAFTTPAVLSPREYGRELLRFTRLKYADKSIIPPDGLNFPHNFEEIMQDLHKRFFRVYAHAYLHHFHTIQNLGIEAHVNCLFKHFIFFTMQNRILSQSDMAPMKTLIVRFEDQAQAEQEAKLLEARARAS